MAAGDTNIQGNIDSATVGLDMDSVTSMVKQGKLSYALNAVIENFDGDMITYQNEMGNSECVVFPAGFQLISCKHILELNKIFYWLCNPSTNESQIGYSITDECTYNTLIKGDCLNFSMEHPILTVEHEVNNKAVRIYWSDGYNPRRYIDINNLPYKQSGENCDRTLLNEIDCNRINVQPSFKIPIVRVADVVDGGTLKEGVYQFAVQYSDAVGTGYTSYYCVSNPASIFENASNPQFDAETGKAIRLSVLNLDTEVYSFFNLAVIETINNISTPRVIGTYPTSSNVKQITYTGQYSASISITIDDIFAKYPIYKIADGVTQTDKVLIWYGLTEAKRNSYQKIANQIKLNWVSYRLPSDKAYKDGETSSLYRGYMGDEVYAFEFVPILSNGKQCDGFHIPGRASDFNDTRLVDNSLKDTNDTCDESPASVESWRVKNTAISYGKTDEFNNFIQTGIYKNFGDSTANKDPKCYVGPYEWGEFGYYESEELYPCNEDIWGSLANTPIRHHKFPDSTIRQIHDDVGNIYPLGVRVDIESVRNAIANSNLSEEEKNEIVGFKIVRANRANNKSIIAKGLINNVGKYDKEGTSYYYFNYPYNDVRSDPFLCTSQSRDDTGRNEDRWLNGFSTEESKKRFSFHSPDTHFFQPYLGDHIKLETVEYGTSIGHFKEVKNHPKYKSLSRGAYVIATAMMSTLVSVASREGTGPFGTDVLGGAQTPWDQGMAIFQDLINIFEKIITYRNFAYQFNSVGNYTSSKPFPHSTENIYRLSEAKYVNSALTTLNDGSYLNAFLRESSIYLNIDEPVPFTHELYPDMQDTSRYTMNQVNCDPNKINEKRISSYYTSIKKNLANQYGAIYSYETIDTGYYYDLQTNQSTTPDVFGGDTYINKFAYKIKQSFFTQNLVGRPDGIGQDFRNFNNLAYPTYWISNERNQKFNWEDVSATLGDIAAGAAGGGLSSLSIGGAIRGAVAGGVIGGLQTIIGADQNNFDCLNGGIIFQSGKFYLFSYGIPYFYCESEVNVDYRQAYNNKEGDFYPNVGTNIPDEWLQETNVPIVQDNTYTYNKTFSKQNKENNFTHLPEDFDIDEVNKYDYRAIYSEKQSNAINYKINNWLIYKPLSYFDFPQSYGKLISIDGIQNRAVLVRFENRSQLYNTMLTINTSNPQAAYIGNQAFFTSSPPIDLFDTTLGYAGSQHKFLLKTEYGVISVDAKRGNVVVISGNSPKSITTGVSKFLKNNLSFKIKSSFPEINIDNHFGGIGLHGVYDDNLNRIIITKLDYEPIVLGISYNNGHFVYNNKRIELNDPNYFCNKSLTLSYSFKINGWVSFHSYLPNYYIGSNNHFLTGVNTKEGSSSWDHQRNIQLYNTFYGELSPYTIEYPFSFKYNDEILQNIKDYTKVISYIDEVSSTQPDDIYFDEVILYNDQQSSGVLKLAPKPKGNLKEYMKYPIYATDSKTIIYTKSDNFYNINTFWSLNRKTTDPIWLKSCKSLSYDKVLNQSNHDYSKRSFSKSPLKAKDLKVRFTLNGKNTYKFLSQFIVNFTQKSFK